MKLDLVFFDDKILVSKEPREPKVWQEKLHFFERSQVFNDQGKLFEYLRSAYTLTDKDRKNVEEVLLDMHNKDFLIEFSGDEENNLAITKISLDHLKGQLVYWDEWDWSLTKQNDDYFLWVYVGGIADMVREIKLSSSQENDFIKSGKPFIETLAKQLQKLNSPVYSEAIQENRKIV